MKKYSDIPKILLVDDEAGIREVLADILKEQNFIIKEASDGQEALEALKQETFSAVLCDIMMPNVSGLDCLSSAQIQNIKTPFVFITGYADESRMLQAIRLGAVDFINKPFVPKEVLEVTYRVLQLGARQNDNLELLKQSDPRISEAIQKNDRLISIMRACNNKKRVG